MRQRLGNVATDRLFHVFSARRSGQHAIMRWLIAQLRSPVARLNMCNIPHSIGPYGRRLLGPAARQQQRALFMNYEDMEPAEVQRCDGVPGLVTGVDAAQVTCVLILRDPFNNLASKREANPERDLDFGKLEVARWKALAREFLGETNYLPDKICINFNRWFSDAEYRRQIAAALDLDYPVDSPPALVALQAVPTVGRSQFDGRDYDGNAQQMDVLNRWRQRLDDPIFVELVRDEELRALSTRIFTMPEVDAWLSGALAR